MADLDFYHDKYEQDDNYTIKYKSLQGIDFFGGLDGIIYSIKLFQLIRSKVC